MTIVFQWDHTPILHLVVTSDDASDMQSPSAIFRKLIVTQLAERDAQLCCPTGIGLINRCTAFPYGIPALVDLQFVGHDQVGLVTT